jgi:hypothetical protein
MITPTMGMIIRTTDIMRTTVFVVNREALPSDLTILPDWTPALTPMSQSTAALRRPESSLRRAV